MATAELPVSVIVPVYNTERYLTGCIDSLLHQSFSDFELILVNDGSTDGSKDICGHYAEIDSRVRLLSQSNQGQQAAIQRGVSLANGKWLFFVDSDDRLPEDAIQKLYDYCNDEIDIIVGFSFPGDGSVSRIPVERWRELQISSSEILCTRWGKLYRRNIVTQEVLQTPSNIRVGEDMIMNIKAAFNSDKPVTVVQTQVYYYNRNPGSDSSTYRWTPEKFHALYEAVSDAIPPGAGSRYRHAAIRNGIGMLCGIILKGTRDDYRKLEQSPLLACIRSDTAKWQYRPGFNETIVLNHPSKWLTRQWIRARRSVQIIRQYINRNLLKH